MGSEFTGLGRGWVYFAWRRVRHCWAPESGLLTVCSQEVHGHLLPFLCVVPALRQSLHPCSLELVLAFVTCLTDGMYLKWHLGTPEVQPGEDQLDPPRLRDLRKQSLTAQKSHHMAAEPPVYTIQPHSLLQWRGPHEKVVLVGSLWRQATTGVSSVLSKGRGRGWGREPESQETRLHRDVKSSDSPLTGRKSAATGTRDVAPVSSVFLHGRFLKSLLLMTHTQGRACTWGLASPAQNQSSHQHPGSITGVPEAWRGTYAFCRLVQGLCAALGLSDPRVAVPIMSPSWFLCWGLPSVLTSSPFTPLGFLEGTGILWLCVEIVASLVIFTACCCCCC